VYNRKSLIPPNAENLPENAKSAVGQTADYCKKERKK
jgi:hypothetical protein